MKWVKIHPSGMKLCQNGKQKGADLLERVLEAEKTRDPRNFEKWNKNYGIYLQMN